MFQNKFSQRQIFIISLIIGILIFVSIIINILIGIAAPSQKQSSVSPTQTPASLPDNNLSEPSIQFSGFHSNITVQNLNFINPQSVNIKPEAYPVYYASYVNKNYVQNKISNNYAVRNTQDTVYIDNHEQEVRGNITINLAISNLTGYCHDILGLDTNLYTFNAVQKGNIFQVDGMVQLNGIPLFNLDETNQIIGEISTSGQILHIELHKAFSSIKVLNPIKSVRPVLNSLKPSLIGLHLSDNITTENISNIQNDPIQIQSVQRGYFFDWQTGFIFPIGKMTTIVPLQSSSKIFHVAAIVPIIEPNNIQGYIPSVTVAQTMDPNFAYD